MKVDTKLTEKIKKEQLEFSLKTNVKTDLKKVKALFKVIYELRGLTLKNVKLFASPDAVQTEANRLLNSSQRNVQTSISSASLAPIISCYKYLLAKSPKLLNSKHKFIAKNFNCYYYAVALTDTLLVSEFPISMSVDDQHRLHNLNGPSLEFKDGFKTFHFSGNVVDRTLVETPIDKVTPKMFASIQNADIRRDFIKRIGLRKLSELLSATVINQEFGYKLIEFKLNNEPHRFLQMVNPSMSKDFFECDDDIKQLFYDNMDNNPEWVVHIEGVPDSCNTVLDALKARNTSFQDLEFKIELQDESNFLPDQLT